MDNELENFPSNISVDSDDEPILDLDVNMLQQLVSSRLERNCVSTRRLAIELNYEIHLLQFDNGPDCIAQLSRNQIYPEAKFASEVATMKYVAQNTRIKVPKVYDWDCSAQNVIKTPYILMERLPGQPLHKVWDELTVENKKSVLSQIIDILFELWKCQFEKIGCLYDQLTNDSNDSSNSIHERASYPISDSLTEPNNVLIGPIVSPLFYTEGRDAVNSFKGPFGSSRELINTLIQKEKMFFKNYGVQELNTDENLNQEDAEKRVKGLVKQLKLLESKKLLEDHSFYKSIDLPPFVLIHNNFDAYNILVSVDEDVKIVGIIDWEFSRVGTLWDLCNYPIWIREVEVGPLKVLSDEEVQESREKQDLRNHFRNEMITRLGDKSGQMLDVKEQDVVIEALEFLVTSSVYKFVALEIFLKDFFSYYVNDCHFLDSEKS